MAQACHQKPETPRTTPVGQANYPGEVQHGSHGEAPPTRGARPGTGSCRRPSAEPLGLLSMAKVVFVCWGNICRSPMAERVARAMAAELGIDVETDSVGISSEESGNPIDRRAAAVLRQSGYDPTGHRARRVTLADLAGMDLVVAAENFHISRLELLYPGGNYALLNDFNPAMPKGQDLQDPWYGPASGFDDTLADIEAAMPGILAAVAG